MEHTRDRIYVDGAFVPSTGTGTLPVTNPFSEQVVGTVPTTCSVKGLVTGSVPVPVEGTQAPST